MSIRVLALSALLTCAAFFSGCTNTPPLPPPVNHADDLPTLAGFTPITASLRPAFAPPVLIDEVRAGGEPVIAVTHKGTILVASHPGYTHYHPSDPGHVPTELITPVNGQSYIFRSTDNGTTWSPVLLNDATTNAPRSGALGVSDPEFTVMEDGAVCFTDLEALAAASVACSLDDGLTWNGNPAASGQPVDRQWLASYKNELYFTSNPQGPSTADFRVSTDHGLTWTDRGTTPCNGDVIANPANGHLYQTCGGNKLTVSTDGGATWSAPKGPKGGKDAGLALNEPALDSGGNIWIAWAENERKLVVAGSPDEGKTWPWKINLTPHFALASRAMHTCGQTPTPPANCTKEYDAVTAMRGPETNGTYVWPWVSAGSSGRLAVTWIGAFDTKPSESYDGDWFVFSAFVINGTSSAPAVVVSQLTPAPIHTGPICQQGTRCEVISVQGDPAGDRRLGDFFETTIEPGTGYLLGAWSNTVLKPDDVVGHPQFARQVGGIRLIADDQLATFKPTQG